MADVQSNIQVSIDTTQALASIKNLQRQISAFHTSMAQSGAAANSVTAQMQQNLINSINATGKFSAQMRTIKTTTESFTDSLQKNKFSLGEYFRYAGGASKSFGRLFKTEFETINKVARENVKDLQTQYIKMGRDANGAMKAIAVRPLSLDMNDLATKTMIASERQALLNQLLKQGSTNLLNFGKNTQWAGRQLMVGFTIPLMAVGSAAAKTFMDMETQAIRFKKVYGDLFTPASETKAALEGITELGKEFTKYGIAVSSTVGLAAEAAAAGFQGLDLQRQTTAATRLSILGQVESQKALETTIALQNAFSMSSENLAESIDFLNAVENQTVLSLDDMSTAIPKAAPVIQQLGGDVKDLAFLMTAMKEGGINASEGANALKSGLASLINPTGKANDMLLSFGINAKRIVEDNKGNLKKTVIDFASALNELDPLNRAQVIEQMFGKFQFARLSTLFANVTKDGTQAARVLDLAGSSVQQLASLSEKELGMTAESAMNKFKGAVENLKLSLVPVGEEFLKAVTPVAEFVTKILEKFNGLSDGTKKIIVTITAIVAGLGPVFLMTFGLLANGLANIIKGFVFLKSIFNKAGQSTATLGTEVKYMTLEQRNAAAVAASLDQVHKTLAQTFTAEASAVDALTRAYYRAIAAQRGFIPTSAPVGRGPVKTKGKFANGGIIVGPGGPTSDSVPIMASNGEAIISAAVVKKYPEMVSNFISGNIPGFRRSGIIGPKTVASHIEGFTPAQLTTTLSDPIMQRVLSVLPDVGVSIQRLSTTADGMVAVSRTIETSLRGLSNSLLENNIKDVTAIGTGEFAGTTTQTSSERNFMLNSAGIAGEPITFEQAQEASTKAQSYLDRPSKNETDNTRAQKEEAKILVQEQLDFEKSLVGLSQQEVEARKTDFTKIKSTQALEYTLMQKGLSAEEASTLAKQKIAEAEKATLRLVEEARTDLEKRKIKEAAYKATLLKEMGGVAGYDEKNTKTDVFNRTQLNAVPRDMAKGQIQFGTPYKPGQEVPKDAAVFGSGKSFMGLSGKRVKRNQSAVVDASVRDDYYDDRGKIKALFKRGSKDGTEYTRGVKTSTKDPYETSLDRSSPHPLAATHGKEDGVAYQTAKEKAINKTKEKGTQSGKPRRVATRPQGPAPIGPDAPSGTGFLPMVAPLTDKEKRKDKKQKQKAKAKNKIRLAGSKMNSLGGGMGLLGVNMGLSMMPDFAGKGIAQGALTGANMGMMFGPWGMAAGAAIGLVSSAIGELIEKQKIQKAMTEAVFKSSADMAMFFGNAVVDTTLKVGSLTSSLGILGSTAQSSFGYTNEELASFNEMVNSLPEGNPLKDLITGLTDEKNTEKVLELAQAFVTTQVAIGQIKPDQAQKSLDIILASSGKASMVGSSFIKLSSQVQAVTESLKNASSNSTKLGTALTDLIGAGSNASSLAQVIAIIDGIAASGISAAQAIGSMYNAYLLMGNIGAANSILNLNKIKGLGPEQIARAVIAASKGYTESVSRSTNAKDFDKRVTAFLNDPKQWKKTNVDGSQKTKAYKQQEEEASITKTQINLLKKKKKIIDDQIKQQEKITNELKRQNDYLNKQRDIDQQIIDAKIKGNYIEAAILLQEKNQNTIEFNQETEKSKLQQEADALQAKIDALELKNAEIVDAINKSSAAQSASATADANRVIAAIQGGYPSADKEDGSTASKAFSIPTTKEFVEPFLQKNAPVREDDGLKRGIYKKALDPKKAFDDPLLKKLFFNYVKTFIQQDLDRLANPDDSIVISALGSDGNTYTFRAYKDGRFTAGKKIPPVNKADGGYIKHFGPGGGVSGPGTATSDSIPAMLSDGEYVIKASSVAKYGKKTMDALNAGKYAKGGMVLPSFKKPSSPYNSKNQPTGSPYGRYWGELERLYQQSPLGFDKNGKPIFNNAGKDPWGGTEIPGLPFSGKVANFSDYWHQLAEQPRKSSGPVMGLDKDPMRYAGSGASMSGIGNGVYGAGSWLTYADGGLASRPKYGKRLNWFQRYVSDLSDQHDSNPAWARDPLGSVALLRKIAGIGRKGDNLSAATMPLNFMGMGAGRSLFLGMPRGIKALEEARTAEQTMKAIDAATKTGKFKDLPITQLGQQLEATVGKSFPVRGIGGLYEGADGTKEFVKPVTDALSGLSEIRSNVISRKVGLTTPIQDLIKIMDPSDAKAKRELLALRSAYNPEFANPTGTFTVSEYITQLVASLWRGDKDLQKANLSGRNLVDSGTSGVYDTASGMRKLSTSMPSMQEQAAINLLGVKGGAKRWFAETTAPIAQSMTSAQYHDAIIKEINRQIPLVEETIASFKLTDPDEIQAYANLIDRLKSGAAPGVDWSPFQSMAASVVPAPVKIPTAAALAKKAEELELRKRQSGHAVGFSDLSFKERINGYHEGGLVGHKHKASLPQHLLDMVKRANTFNDLAPHNMGMKKFPNPGPSNTAPHDMAMRSAMAEPEWARDWDYWNPYLPKFTDNQKPESLPKFALNQLKTLVDGKIPPLSAFSVLKNVIQRFESRETGAGIGTYVPESIASDEGTSPASIRTPYYKAQRDSGYGKLRPVYLDVKDYTYQGKEDRKRNLSSIYMAANELTKLTGVPFRVIKPENREEILAKAAYSKYTGPKVIPIEFLEGDALREKRGGGPSKWWAMNSGTITMPRAKKSDTWMGLNPFSTAGGKDVAMHEIIHSFQGHLDGNGECPMCSTTKTSWLDTHLGGIQGNHSLNPFNIMNMYGLMGGVVSNKDIESIRNEMGYYQYKTDLTPEEIKLIQRKIQVSKGSRFANGGLANYKLPSYEVGSPYIPEDQIAQLHKGERVLTAQENKNFSNPGPVTNNITINGADKDPKQIAQEVMLQLERMQSKNNKTNLVGR
jgi:TP901 family phage tail tape measure protein